jgi:hypothetical protein
MVAADEVRTSASETLRSPTRGLGGIVVAFTQTLAHTVTRHNRILSELLDGQCVEGRERELQASAAIQHAFVESCNSASTDPSPGPRAGHPDGHSSHIGSCVHQVATCRFRPEHLTWNTWATEATVMVLAYLISQENLDQTTCGGLISIPPAAACLGLIAARSPNSRRMSLGAPGTPARWSAGRGRLASLVHGGSGGADPVMGFGSAPSCAFLAGFR